MRPRPARPILPTNNKWANLKIAQMDITEPANPGCDGYRYISTIVDTSTGFIDAYNCKNRTDAVIHLCNFLDKNPHIKTVRVDGAPEFHSERAYEAVTKRGVGLQTTAPGASQSLGAAERANRTIKDKITVLLLTLGLENKPHLWPWFTTAAVSCINYTATPSRNGSCPAKLRHEALQELGLEEDFVPLPTHFFGDPVYLQTPREKTSKELERLPNGLRMGIYLGQQNNGVAEVLGFQKNGLVIWVVHPSVISSANDDVLGKMMHKITYYATSYEDAKLRQTILKAKGKVGPEHIFSYPIETDDESDDTLSDEESDERHKKRLRLIPNSYAHHAHPYISPCKYTLAVRTNENETLVMVSPPQQEGARVARLVNGKLDLSTSHLTADYKQFWRGGMPTLWLPDGTIRSACKRTGSHGSFHLRYGYIADDEAPPEDIDSGRFDKADLKEWMSIIDNNVLGPQSAPPEGVRPCRTRFRRTYKTSATLEVIEKSRFLVCETNDKRDVDISTEMPAAWIRRMLVVLGLSKGWRAATIDIKTAFLLVPLPPEHGDIYIRLPSHLPQCIVDLGYYPNATHKLNKSLYGLKESPRLFNEFLADKLSAIGWHRIAGGVFLRPDGTGF